MCTYNGARFLNEQLESISQQTRLPDELVVCDDCSTDQTGDLLRSFSAVAPFPVRLYFNDRNIGSTKNFDQAIRHSTGEVIALCDQDDIWHREKIERTEALLRTRPNIGLVFTDGDVVDEDANPVGQTLWQSIRFGPERQAIVRTRQAVNVLSQNTVATGATMTFRAAFRDWILPIPDDVPLIHDGWIALVISMLAPVDMISEPLIRYRVHPGQQIGTPLNSSVDKTQNRSLREAVRTQTSFEPEIRKLEVVLDRVGTDSSYLKRDELNDLNMRLQHLRTRAAISGSRLTGITAVLGELVSLRYHRYSNGVFSALKDLLC
jgi:cellulose synthase/poly-beta-1,6-N-acetylglucosamine synthase-like glycosyltransferase